MSDSTSSSVEYRIDHEQLAALQSATRTSKSNFNSDISTLSSGIGLLDTDSPIVSEMVSYLSDQCNVDSINEDYNSAICTIGDYLGY